MRYHNVSGYVGHRYCFENNHPLMHNLVGILVLAQLMTRLALLYCNDLDLVPAQFRELAREVRSPQNQAELLDEQEEALSPRRRVRKW